LSQGNITYAMALAPALADEPALARELEWKAQLELIRLAEGVRERIAAILDRDEIPAAVYEFAEIKRRLVRSVPDNGPVSGDEFASRVLGSPAMVSGGTNHATQLDRGTVAARKLSNDEVSRLLAELREEEQSLVARFSRATVQWLQARLNAGTLTSWQDPDAVTALILQAESAEQLSLIRELSHPRAKRRITDSAIDRLTHGLCLRPAPDATAVDWFDWAFKLHEEFGRYEEAEAAYREAIRLDPNNDVPNSATQPTRTARRRRKIVFTFTQGPEKISNRNRFAASEQRTDGRLCAAHRIAESYAAARIGPLNCAANRMLPRRELKCRSVTDEGGECETYCS
jgi:tetratricopeptide (TPR) repeat protein